MVIIEGALDTLYFFFIFLLTVRRIRMFFSLKPSASQGESSLKISAHQDSPFRSYGTNKHTHRLTHSLTYTSALIEILVYLKRSHKVEEQDQSCNKYTDYCKQDVTIQFYPYYLKINTINYENGGNTGQPLIHLQILSSFIPLIQTL